jgi:DNA-binding IclR family transcriptional regulator
MRNSSGSGLESVDNALQLLVLLRGQGLGVTEVARALDVAPSTAHRLLTALCRRGFAERDDKRRYRAGPALDPAVGGRGDEDSLRATVRPYLERLRAETDETVHLVVRDGVHTSFLDGLESTQALRLGSRVGWLLPAHTTSGGLALLAALSDAEVVALYPHGLPDWPTAKIRDLGALRRRLHLVRSQGLAVNRQESEPGVTAIGIALSDLSGATHGALTVSAPSMRATNTWLTATATALQAIARDVAPAL